MPGSAAIKTDGTDDAATFKSEFHDATINAGVPSQWPM
jgi:hypothetical protein